MIAKKYITKVYLLEGLQIYINIPVNSMHFPLYVSFEVIRYYKVYTFCFHCKGIDSLAMHNCIRGNYILL